MNRQLRISYETIGASSYMTVTCPTGMEPVHYQMEMMLSNDIGNLLPVSRQVMDGETVIYYNITSRIALSQFLGKGKLKRKELLNLIEGAVQTVRDASGFGLPESGIMMEMDYIYVNPASCKPEFLYLPVEDAGGWSLKELLSDLVLHDRIAMGDDNLVQVLLRELNSPSFSIDQLAKSLKPYQGMESGNQGAGMAASGPSNIQPSAMGQPMAGGMYGQPMGMTQSGTHRVPNQTPGVEAMHMQPMGQRQEFPGNRGPEGGFQEVVNSDASEAGPKQGKRPFAKKKGGKPEKKKSAAKEKKEEHGDSSGQEFDAEKAKKKFLLPQALVLVVTAACISFGVFVDAGGGIQVNNILAFLIAVGMGEVILYREIYVNSKSKGSGKGNGSVGKKAAEKKKPGKESRTDKGGKPGRPLPPGKKSDAGYQEETAGQTSVQQPGYGVQPGMQPSGYGAQPGMQQGYGIQSGIQQPGYGTQPGIQQPGYGAQPSMQQSGYGIQPGIQSSGYGAQSAVPQPGYGAQPSMRQPDIGTHVSTRYAYGPMAQPVYGNSAASGEADTDIGSETEVWDDGMGGPMSVYLEYYENNQTTRIPMDRPDGILIGRLEGQVDFVVKNPKVGKIHARFYSQGNQCYVVDINSKNGTYINGNRTRIESNTPCMLHDRDRITLANAEFVIHCQDL